MLLNYHLGRSFPVMVLYSDRRSLKLVGAVGTFNEFVGICCKEEVLMLWIRVGRVQRVDAVCSVRERYH